MIWYFLYACVSIGLFLLETVGCVTLFPAYVLVLLMTTGLIALTFGLSSYRQWHVEHVKEQRLVANGTKISGKLEWVWVDTIPKYAVSLSWYDASDDMIWFIVKGVKSLKNMPRVGVGNELPIFVGDCRPGHYTDDFWVDLYGKYKD